MVTKFMSTVSMDKSAALPNLPISGTLLKTLGLYAGAGVALAASTAALESGTDYLRSRRQRAKMAPIFEEMLRLHPKLRNYDLERVKLYYEQLWHFSPKIAENALSAGNYVYHSISYDESGGPGVKAFVELTALEENISKAKGRGLDTGASMIQAAQLVGGAISAPLDIAASIARDEQAALINPYDVAKARSNYVNSVLGLKVDPETGIDPRTGAPAVSPILRYF